MLFDVRQKFEAPEPALYINDRLFPPVLMNTSQPDEPEPDSLPPQVESHTEQGQMNARILAALAALEVGQRALHEENRRIIDLLEEPARLAEEKKQRDAETAAEHMRLTEEGIARGDYDHFSG